MTSITEQSLSAIILIHIFSVVLTIVSIYGNVKLWRKRNEMFIQKRSLSIVLGLNSSFILIIIAYELLVIMVAHSETQMLYIIPLVLMFFALWLLLCMLIIKTWMLYFKINWTHYTLEYKWQQLINSNVLSLQTSQEQNWFIVNNKKYGNLGFMYKLIGSICFIAFLIVTVPATIYVIYGFPTYILIIAIICMCLTIIPAVTIYVIITKKTPAFEDLFYIHWESTMHSKILIFWMVCNVIASIVDAVVSAHTFDVWIYVAPVYYLIWFAMNYISTFVIDKKNNVVQSETEKIHHSSTHISLDMVLSNKTAFHCFMMHLSQEYSMECLLSYIEFMQFQNYLLESISVATINKIRHTKFPSNIPVSEIIEHEEKLPDDYDGDVLLSVAKIKAHKIFNKYIKNYAEFEINISWAERNRLRNILDNLECLFQLRLDKKDLFVMFEPCKEEMLALLKHSLKRFQRKKIWREQVAPVFPKKEMNELSENEVKQMMHVISNIEEL